LENQVKNKFINIEIIDEKINKKQNSMFSLMSDINICSVIYLSMYLMYFVECVTKIRYISQDRKSL